MNIRFWIFTVVLVSSSIVTISHRGASGYLPEHTIGAYKLASSMGVTFVEPDVVLSKDGHFIVSHDICFNHTTNISKIKGLSNRLSYKKNSDEMRVGYFSEEFTLSEIKKLQVRQRYASRDQSQNWVYPVQTLEEVIEWALEENKSREDKFGLYIEMKSAAHFNRLGFNMEEKLLDLLKKYSLHTQKEASQRCPIILQSFEFDTIKKLAAITDLPLAYLMYAAEIEKEVEEVIDYVQIIAPNIPLLLDSNLNSTGLAQRVHSYGLKLHAWGLESSPDYKLIHQLLLKEKVDGFFTEFPDRSISYVKSYR